MAKVAIVTGGNRGIGKAIAETITQLEYEVHTPHLSGGVDVRNPESVKEYVRKFKQIDLLVNNAGICEARPLLVTTNEFFDNTMKTNAYGPYYFSRLVSTRMKEGSIINIASIAGTNGFSGMIAYGMSKFALIGLTLHMAEEFRDLKIRVNAICPGAVKTEMTKNVDERYLTGTDEICKRVVYLIERNVTGKVF